DLPPDTYTVTFNVSDSEGALQGANVTFNGETKATNDEGMAVFTGVLAGSRAYTVSKEGYNNSTGNVNVESDESVDVTLTKKTHTITASAGSGGRIDPTGEVIVEHGSSKTFTMSPSDGYSVEDVLVDGESVGPRSTYTFNNITSNHTISVSFKTLPPDTYTVTFNVSDSEGAAVQGANVTFNGETKATDTEGMAVFTGVLAGSRAYTVSKEGYNNSTGNVNVESDESVDITLIRQTYTLTVNAVGEGTVTKNPDKATYTHGEVVQLTANPAENWIFAGWSGDLNGSANPINITMNTDKTVTGNFARVYTVSFNVSDTGGAVQGANVAFNGETRATDGQGKAVFTGVLAGSKAYTITKEGYNNANGEVNVDGDKAINVTLTKKTYTFTVNTVGKGTVTKNPDKATYTHGEVVQLTANPDSGWNFDSWSGDLTGSTNPVNITMNENKTVTANFSEITYTITFNVSDLEGAAVQGANVAFNSVTKTTDSQGKAIFTGVTVGEKQYRVSKDGYGDVSGSVIVDSSKSVDVVLEKRPMIEVVDKTFSVSEPLPILIRAQNLGEVNLIEVVIQYDTEYFDASWFFSVRLSKWQPVFKDPGNGIIHIGLSPNEGATKLIDELTNILSIELTPKKAGTTELAYTSYTSEGGVPFETNIITTGGIRLSGSDLILDEGKITITN
ncbi:carboxypeptidase regulatory-like domain-containing protein, partial [Mesotoga sp. Brook.08.YT.4.2.5.4.]|uniref:carboxypeptidase regulatory-like domain-containing protein n=1 Tax=Mesotoga sp. Brook.08.YT.4.2.5.4. TaxID=1343998 RepID=UPI0015EB8053